MALSNAEVLQKLFQLKELALTMQNEADLHVEDMDDLVEASEYISDKAKEIMALVTELEGYWPEDEEEEEEEVYFDSENIYNTPSMAQSIAETPDQEWAEAQSDKYEIFKNEH